MWIWYALMSAALLGVYDVAKKKAVQRNGVLAVLFCATAMTALFLLPFITPGAWPDHLRLMFKAVLVTVSWVSGLIGIKLLPLTTASTIKGIRPVLVVLFSIILFGERLNLIQWIGVAMAIFSLYLLSGTSKKEGIDFSSNRGVIAMGISVLAGVASALYDKHIMASLEPLFVQSWTNIYITVLLGATILFKHLRLRRLPGASAVEETPQPFRWDWTLLLIAVLITVSDFIYFRALKEPDAMLSIISVIRRGSVIVSFLVGAWLFKEHRIREKALVMCLMFTGIALLTSGSC